MDLDRTPGAFVISLDFELSWGVRERRLRGSGYDRNLLGGRAAVPRLLDIFSEYGIAATWATVGFLFADSREELLAFAPPPEARPKYKDAQLDPYADPMGADERSAPLQFAGSLIQLIAACPQQEIATHTFSHFYCLEEGQNQNHFKADLESALAIARARGIQICSIAFPRNQHNPTYNHVLKELNIFCYRGNTPGNIYRATSTRKQTLAMRAYRLADSYLPLTASGSFAWSAVARESGLCNVPASRFLRPPDGISRLTQSLQEMRITAAMRQAAKRGAVYHLWWHPHNFGAEPQLCFASLRRILNEYRQLHRLFGFTSLSMAQAATKACQT